MDELKKFEGKSVFIKLKIGRSYSGKVLEIENKGSMLGSFITIKDKFGKRVGFYSTEISVIEEEDNRN